MANPGSGNAGEAAVLAALAKRGWNVMVPFGEGHPFDLGLHVGDRGMLRIQCKTAWPRAGCLVFNARSTDHGTGPKSYLGTADLFGVYFPPADAVYLLPIGSVAESGGRLRLEPTRNNQRRRVRLAARYEIDRWSDADLLALAAGAPAELAAPAADDEAPVPVA